jgi:hypothetical protein
LRAAFKQLQEKTKEARDVLGKIGTANSAYSGTYDFFAIQNANPDTVKPADIIRMTA